MKRTRHRSRGVGVTNKATSPFGTRDTYRTTIRFAHRRNVPGTSPKPDVFYTDSDVKLGASTVPKSSLQSISKFFELSVGRNGTWGLGMPTASIREELGNLVKGHFTPEVLDATGLNATLCSVSEDTQSMTDVVGSGFKSGKNIVLNPCSSSKISMSSDIFPLGNDSVDVVVTDGSFVDQRIDGVWHFCYYFNIQVVVNYSGTAGLSSAAYDAVKSLHSPADSGPSSFEYLYSQAYQAVSDSTWEVLTTLAELQKTVSYLGSTLKRANRILRAARRGDFSWIKKGLSSRNAAEKWLEARYAIRPLVYDVRGALAVLDSSGSLSKGVIKRRFYTNEQTEEAEFSFSDGETTYHFLGAKTVSTVARSACYATLRVNLPKMKHLGLFNPATTAFEVIPWSFVVNWFVDVSGLLSRLNPNPIYNINGGFISVKNEVSLVGSLTFLRNGIECIIPFRYNSESYSREVRMNPTLVSLNWNFSVPKLVDLLSIGRSRVS